jgi:Mrr N-terminal domain
MQDEEMKIPRSVDLVPLVLEALQSLGGAAPSREIDDFVIQRLGLSAELIRQPHSDGQSRTEIKYRLAWSRTLARRSGLIVLDSYRTWTLKRP